MSKVLYNSNKTTFESVLDKAFVSASKASTDILRQTKAVAQSDCSVIIFGDSGTGKELVANFCHRNSMRKYKPFIAVNCAALPEDLLESELFGHKKGSFTGAISENEGLIRRANKGTLFLDEIGDMSLKTQAKLLRVLQEKKVRPVGGGEEVEVDFRVICATHKNILKNTQTGSFRSDLYFRLSVVPIYIPPLRSRPDDIVPLAKHFINRIAASRRDLPKQLSICAIDRLLSHDWPGNVRELQNVIERALVFSHEHIIDSSKIRFDSDFLINNAFSDHQQKTQNSFNLKSREKIAIEEALDCTNGVKTQAARLLGIDRKTLLRKEREYSLSKI